MHHPPSPTIDALLERYLTLLDEYTTLRAELSRLQTATFHNLARANFAAERGVRFGRDYYDERMQAGRRVVVRTTTTTVRGQGDDDAAGNVLWEVVKVGGATTTDAESVAVASGEEEEEKEKEKEKGEEEKEGQEEKLDAKKKKQPQQQLPKDPIRWFGLLTPLALRQTQASAVDAVERVIPRLVTVNAEMRQVEIEVRRARKRRAKAEAAAAAGGGAAIAKQATGQEALRAEMTAS